MGKFSTSHEWQIDDASQINTVRYKSQKSKDTCGLWGEVDGYRFSLQLGVESLPVIEELLNNLKAIKAEQKN